MNEAVKYIVEGYLLKKKKKTPENLGFHKPPPSSPVEQAILNLSKVVGTFVEE